MPEVFKAVIPYESLDPLTIGSSGDETKVSRETIELEIAEENLLAALYPAEPDPVGDATEAARAALESPASGPRFSELVASATRVCVIIDNQFRPTPQAKLLPPVLDAVEAAGKPAVVVSTRGTPVWLHREVAACDVKISIGQAQSNHWGAGGGGKLILPGVVSDETVESNHCAFVPSPQTHYGAYAGPMRSDIDEVATMCGLDVTMNVLLDTRGRVLEAVYGSHPDAHRTAIERFNRIYTYEHPGEQADIAICGVFAPTDHLFFHTGWGCMSADFVVKDGGTIIYCSPSPGVSTAIGDFPGLALMDLMQPYMPATPENYQRVLKDIHARAIQMWAGCIWVPIYEVMTRKHLKLVTLEDNLGMAADIGIDATTSLDDAFAEAMNRHGPDAKVIVLPYARSQQLSDASRSAVAQELVTAKRFLNDVFREPERNGSSPISTTA